MAIGKFDVAKELIDIIEAKQAVAGRDGRFYVTYKELGERFGLKPRYAQLYAPLGEIVGWCAERGLPILPSVVVSVKQRKRAERSKSCHPIPGGGFATAYVGRVALRGASVDGVYRNCLEAVLTADAGQYGLLCGRLQSQVHGHADWDGVRQALELGRERTE